MGKFGFDGNSCSLHGPFLGPDGRFYLAGGQHGYEIAANIEDAPARISDAAGVFSCLPDGSDRLIHLAGGMDNPVEVDFTQEGEPLGTVNLFLGNPRADCLMHWLWGGVYPKRSREDRLAQFKRTGDLLPYTTNLGHVAVSGLTRYRSGAFGEEYRDNFFIAEFNTRKIIRVRLDRSGSTFRSKVEDFLTTSFPDAHFTDVIEDADGSLLVIDTGGWYRHGCPTSQIAKPEILGAVYRVRKSGAPQIRNPRGEDIKWETMNSADLVSLLEDPRFWVQDRALATLAHRGEEAVEPLQRALFSEYPSARTNAVWGLSRLRAASSRAALREALAHSDPSVVQACLNAIALSPDPEAVDRLRRILESGPPHHRRSAATALGRIGDQAAVPSLLAALEAPVDRELEHAILYALIEIDDSQSTREGLSNQSLFVQRGALVALGQMNSGSLQPSEAVPLLSVPDAPLREAALEIVTRREGWGNEIVRSLEQWLSGETDHASREDMIRGALAAFMENESVQKLSAESLLSPETSLETRIAVLDALAEFPFDATPELWLDSLSACLVDSATGPLQIQACRAVGALGVADLDDRLLAMGAHCCLPIKVRLAAWEAVALRANEVDDQSFVLLTSQLHEKVPILDRIRGAKILARTTLNEDQLLQLLDHFPNAGALVLPHLLIPFEKSSDGAVGEKLADVLERAQPGRGLSSTEIGRIALNFPPEVGERLLAAVGSAETEVEERIDRIRELAPLVADRGPEAGQRVFYSQKAACSVCHRIDGLGGGIGPDLSHIGQIRSATDLLESILYPSASIAQGYEPFSVFTIGGEVHTGVLAREDSDSVSLADASGASARIPRGEIEEIRPGEISIMPEGLDRTLEPMELAELVGYLLGRR